jgi:hypothetical protein
MKEHRYGAGALEKDVDVGQTELDFDKPDASFASSSPDPKFPIQLNAEWSVLFDRLQWILCHWSGGQPRYRSFCCTRDGLLRCIREECIADIDPAALIRVRALPEWHEDRGGGS